MSLVSPNGRSMKWTGNELVLNGATSNLSTSGSVYLNKTGPDDDNSSGFWLGVSANNPYFSVGGIRDGSSNYFKYNGADGTVKIKGVESVDGITLTSGLGMRYYTTSGSLTITGGTGNGAQYGAQIDLVGNNYSVSGGPIPGLGGQLVLQAGDGSSSSIAFHTNNNYFMTSAGPASAASGPYDPIVGVQRLVINTEGLVRVARAKSISLSPGAQYTVDAGNLWAEGNLSVGEYEPAQGDSYVYSTGTGIIRAATLVYAPTISATSTLGTVVGGTSYTIGTNGWGNRTLSNTPGAPGSGTGNNGDIYLVYS